MAVLIGKNTTVEVQAAIAVAKTVNYINKQSDTGSPTGEQCGVTSHGYSNGDVIVFLDVEGMTQLDGQVARVANAKANSFDIEGIDTSDYATFTSGTVAKITSFYTLGVARSVQAGNVGANRLDATTLIDSERQYVLGMPDTPEITVDMLSDPLDSAVVAMDTAARNGTNLVFRLTMSDDSIRLFRGLVTNPSESISVNELVTGQVAITQTRRRLAYAS